MKKKESQFMSTAIDCTISLSVSSFSFAKIVLVESQEMRKTAVFYVVRILSLQGCV